MTASPTPPDAQVGLPSEEEIARVLVEAMGKKPLPDDIWRKQVASFRDLEAMFPDYAQGYSLATDAFRQARAILDLIRPAFEAVEHECQSSMMEIARERARADAAEAKLAQAVEALNEAAETIEYWGQYASSYLQEKHDLAGDIRRARSAAAMGEKR